MYDDFVESFEEVQSAMAYMGFSVETGFDYQFALERLKNAVAKHAQTTTALVLWVGDAPQ